MSLIGRISRCLGAASAAVASLAFAPATSAQDVEAFYKGRQINVISSATAGSGYDNYARLVARHIVRFIPGSPSVVVQSMPAAAGLAQANYMYNQAPKDGSVFGIIFNNMTVEPLIGNTNARFDPGKFSWLGSVNRLTNICVAWHTKPVRTIADLRRQEWIVGGTALSSSTVQQANTFKVLGGAKLKVVPGYAGTTEMLLAMERGELDISCGIGWDSVKSSTSLLDAGKIVPVMQLGYQKVPELSDVPFIYDMLLDPSKKDALDFITIRLDIGRAFAGPPGIPADRLAVLRKAFWTALNDPDLRKDAKAEMLDLDPQTGEDVQAKVIKLGETPKRIIDEVNEIVTDGARDPSKAKN